MYPFFSREFHIGSEHAGAPLFMCNLVFSESGVISGQGQIVRHGDAALDLRTHLVGHDAAFDWHAGAVQIIQITGYAAPPNLITGHPNVLCTIVLDSERPDFGVARLEYFPVPGAASVVLGNVPVLALSLVPVHTAAEMRAERLRPPATLTVQ